MAWVATAVVGGAVIGAGASMWSGHEAAKAQKDATNAAAAEQQKTNDQNYKMFQESRGSNGSAVLPLYLKGSNGGLFEGQLGNDLVDAYGQSSMPLSTFRTATGQLKPGQTGAVNLTNDIFNGGVTNRLLDNAAPVQQQRLVNAQNSSLDALHKTLNEIDAQQASRGYVGDSYGTRLLKFQAGKAAGDAIGAARVQNLQDTADIKNYGDVTLPMQNITLPFLMAQQYGNAQFLPNDLWLNSLSQRMQPFNFLKIGYTGPFQYQPLPTPGPGAFSGTANMIGAVGGFGSQMGGAALNYFMQQQNQQNLLRQNNAMTAWNNNLAFNPPSNFNTLAPMQQYAYAQEGAHNAAVMGTGPNPFE